MNKIAFDAYSLILIPMTNLTLSEIRSTWDALLKADDTLAKRLDLDFSIFVTDSPGTVWTVMARAQPGVRDGAGAGVEMHLSESDLCGIASGNSNPQALFQLGKIKLKGDPEAILRFDFLLARSEEVLREKAH